jgi:hypothetical protein
LASDIGEKINLSALFTVYCEELKRNICPVNIVRFVAIIKAKEKWYNYSRIVEVV